MSRIRRRYGWKQVSFCRHFDSLPRSTNYRERERKRALTRTPFPYPKSMQGDRVFALPVQLWSIRSGTGTGAGTFTSTRLRARCATCSAIYNLGKTLKYRGLPCPDIPMPHAHEIGLIYHRRIERLGDRHRTVLASCTSYADVYVGFALELVFRE